MPFPLVAPLLAAVGAAILAEETEPEETEKEAPSPPKWKFLIDDDEFKEHKGTTNSDYFLTMS